MASGSRRKPESTPMGETPANGGYLLAAYVVAAVILVGYFVSLVRRARRASRDD
jgi:hypothetical protein